jgi:hypothetical protein
VIPVGCIAQRYGSYVISQPKQRVDHGLVYVIKSGPLRDIKLPVLTRFPDPEVMQSVNADLASVRRELAKDAKDCTADVPERSYWEDVARVDIFTRNVLSIYVGISIYCGGPHPDDDYMPLTYNMRIGKRFDFQKDAAQLFVGDSLPTEQLLDLYRNHYGKPEGGCELSDITSDDIQKLNLHFAADGLVINPDLPHVVAACGPEIVIPYDEIKPLVKPDNPFASLFTPKPQAHAK